MKGIELVAELGRAFAQKGTGSGLVMVKDKKTGKMFSVKGVVTETHDDADGSTTHWIEVEEF